MCIRDRHQLHHLGGFWGRAGSGIIGTAVLVIGVLVLFAPWWLQNVRELTSERRARVRIEERARMVEMCIRDSFESLDERLEMLIKDLVWWATALKIARDAG